MLCRYANIFGPPRTGVHAVRILDVAVVDAVLALALASAIAKATKWSLLRSALITFILGIVLHRAFCVRTTLDKVLFPA